MVARSVENKNVRRRYVMLFRLEILGRGQNDTMKRIELTYTPYMFLVIQNIFINGLKKIKYGYILMIPSNVY